MKPGSLGLVLLVTLSIGFASSRSLAQEAAPQEPNVQSPPTKSELRVQPIPFSHKKHLSFGLNCKQCHANPEPGDRMTFPPAAKCMVCHVTIAKDKPAVRKLAEFAQSNQPIPWIRVYVVSSWVYWNHRSHLEAKMTCEQCHGQVDQMEVMTRAVDVTTMAGCIDCHRKNNASTGCRFCHSDK